MIKKFIIATDINVRIGNPNDEMRHFSFVKKNMYDTIEEAEARIIEISNKPHDESRLHRPVYYTIIPIYNKK